MLVVNVKNVIDEFKGGFQPFPPNRQENMVAGQNRRETEAQVEVEQASIMGS